MTLAAGRSEAVEWQLVASVFNGGFTLILGAVVLQSAAFVGWYATHQRGFVLWAGAMLGTLAVRLVLEWAFRRRRAGPNLVAVWRRRFTAGAWAMGAVWGGAALVVVAHVTWQVEAIVVTSLMVITMGAAARNSGCPFAVRGQIFFALAPMFVVLMLARDAYFHMFAAGIAFEFVAVWTLVSYLNAQTVRLLCVNEENIALVAEIRRGNEQLAAANDRLEVAATTDALTGIANRRLLDAVLRTEVRRAQRVSSSLSLLLLDIDFFKGFNDVYGHRAGDDCLRRVAHEFAGSFQRPADLAARYGGEEFVAILPQTDAPSALALAEQVRARIEALAIVHAGGCKGFVTVSIGVATGSPERQPWRPEDLIQAADEAVYAAKNAGRNRVRVAPEAQFPNAPRATREGALL